jgi:hypothetical protein
VYVPAHNVTASPIVIDFEGRTIGGGEWGVVDQTDDALETALDSGWLVLAPKLDPKAKDLHPAAVDAVDLAALLEDRRAAVADLPAGKVRALAADASLVDEVDELDDLRLAFVRRMVVRRADIELPADPKPATGTAKKAAAPSGGPDQ